MVNPMPAALPLDIKHQAQHLVASGMGMSDVAVKLGVNRNTIKNWCTKDKVPQMMDLAKQAVQTIVNQHMADIGIGLRERLAKSVAKQAQLLEQYEPVCVEELKNTPARQGLAAVTKTVIESCNLLYGEPVNNNSGLSMKSGSLSDDLKGAIDIEEVEKPTLTKESTIESSPTSENPPA